MGQRGVKINSYHPFKGLEPLKGYLIFFLSFLFNTTTCLSQITISGNPISLCSSAAGSGNYFINPIANATYFWTVPNGMVITSGQGTNSINTSWTAISIHTGITGSICVTIDSLGTIFNSCITIDLNDSAPFMPNSITGSPKICQGDTVNYSVSLVSNASYYNWIVPSGTSILNGSGSASIIISVDSFNASGLISVAVQNSCGSSAFRTRAVLTNMLNAPSLINGYASGVCKQLGVVYSCPSVLGATSYNWSLIGAGATIIGSNTDTFLIVDFDSTATTNIMMVNAVNGCGNGANRALTVTSKPATADPISGSGTVCGNQQYPYSVAIVSGANFYTWTVPLGSTVANGQSTNSIIVHFDSIPQSNLSIGVKTGNDCGIAAPRLLNGVNIISCPLIGIDEYSYDVIHLFPNPVDYELSFDLKNYYNKEITAEIFDASGRLVYSSISKADYNSRLRINTEGLSSGFYILLLQSENINTQKRFVIE